MAKRSKKHSETEGDGPRRACEVEGCAQEGAYKAPKSRQALHEYRYFCLEHIQAHNKQWDYFSGMNSAEIEAFMKDAVTGHRPTWERMAPGANPQEKLYTALNEFLQEGRRKTKPIPQVSAKIRKALAVLELDYPYQATDLKNQYKKMVKRTHPDHHPGDKLAEERFKAVTSAYKILDAHLRGQS